MSVSCCGFSDGKLSLKLTKKQNGKDVTFRGAFACDTTLEICLEIPRKSGVSFPALCIRDDSDNGEYERRFDFDGVDGAYDVFSTRIDTKKMCKDGEDGLFFWTVKLVLSDSVLYLSSINNVDFCLTDKENEVKRFRLLVYKKDFSTPDWAKGAVMYQIFVDRFARGSKPVPVRDDAVMIEDWYGGIPEYAEKVGDPLKNNTFFGGDLWGVAEKLDYLEALGINVIYLCPVFKAYSNHKYDTGDYETVDEMFGGDEAFDNLVKQAKKRGMKIILDGVFNHTGDDSKYFNRYGKYNNLGAYQSQESEYFDWYGFEEYPDKYEAWWGIEILPRIKGKNSKVRDYFLSENGIVRKWLKRGIDGWRLDVADELDEGFLEGLTSAAKSQKKDCLVIGEVWENAADKISYGERRKYFRGSQLDSVMNYPVKYAIIDYVKYGDAEKFYNAVTEIYSSYPPFCSDVLMNLVGSHDTERILTVLGGENPEGHSNRELSTMRMTPSQKQEAVRRLETATVLQFTLPGMPMIYYGDEAGMEGYHDPFCRFPFPWGNENQETLSHYKKLCRIKRNETDLQNAPLEFEMHSDGVAVYTRGKIKVLVNAGHQEKTVDVPSERKNLLTGERVKGKLSLLPMTAVILK